MTALARKLQSRGHDVVFIGVPDIESVVRAADLEFVPFCENEYPLGTVAKTWGAVANLHGLDVLRYTSRKFHLPLVASALEKADANELKSKARRPAKICVPFGCPAIGYHSQR